MRKGVQGVGGGGDYEKRDAEGTMRKGIQGGGLGDMRKGM